VDAISTRNPPAARSGTALRLGALGCVLLVLCKASFAAPVAVPVQTGMRVVRNVPYGADPAQRFDVYMPAGARDAPVIFMVHGGGWRFGDKSARGVVENKVARWVPRGFVLVSTNYRMLPKANPVEQAKDVARALAVAQDSAAAWGADRTKFVLMGHSAGAHLVALVATSPTVRSGLAVTPWLGVVSLESGALDVAPIMRVPHARLYDRAFGRDTAFWRAASPLQALDTAGPPMLLVCSIPRGTSCVQADRFVAKASSLGMRASTLGERLSHADADGRLGVDSSYTAAVENFLRSLDMAVALALSPATSPPHER
jgi:acetyl esterase/lipase